MPYLVVYYFGANQKEELLKSYTPTVQRICSSVTFCKVGKLRFAEGFEGDEPICMDFFLIVGSSKLDIE